MLFIRTALAFLLFTYIGISWSQSNFVLVKTESGCGYYSDPTLNDGLKKIADIKITWHWEGECIGGLAQGLGISKLAYVNQYVNGSHSTRQHYHAGYPVGYGKHTFNSKNLSLQSWLFSHQEKSVGFNGLGFIGNDALLSPTTVLLPEERPSEFQKNQSLMIPARVATFMGGHCGLNKDRFPDCGFGEGEGKYDVFYMMEMPRSGDGSSAYNARIETFCPEPRNIQSCNAMVQQKAAVYRTEILAFINQNKAAVEDTLQRMNAVLVAAGKAAPGAAVNAPTSTTNRVAPSADPTFMQSLNTYTVGQLFSMADDYESKKDTATARVLLRKLIERFPNHALAALAAKQLAALQN
jgi:hypothetical protein